MQQDQPLARPASSASASSSPYPWANQYDIKPNINNSLNNNFDHLDMKNSKDNDDVEVMSTDSSSSSSSDSQ